MPNQIPCPRATFPPWYSSRRSARGVYQRAILLDLTQNRLKIAQNDAELPQNPLISSKNSQNCTEFHENVIFKIYGEQRILVLLDLRSRSTQRVR